MRLAPWTLLLFAVIALGACSGNPRPKAGPDQPPAREISETSETTGDRCHDGPDASLATPPARKFAVARRDPADIQRVVRANFDRFSACYERALTRLPNLRGRVSTKFTIEPDGSVSNQAPWFEQPSRRGSGELLDCEVVTCVVNGFASLRFARVDGDPGITMVVYPLIFNPNNDDDPSALAVLERLQPEFKRCYQAGPHSNPPGGGSVIIVTRVAPSGAVTSTEPDAASWLDPKVVACVQRVVAGAIFDPSATAHTLDVPVRFKRADEGDR